MRFIKLTNKSNETVFVNVNNILTFARYDENTTYVRMIDGVTWVRETPDEILLKIQGD